MSKIILFLKSVLCGALVVCLIGCGKDTAYYMENELSEVPSTEQAQEDSLVKEQKEDAKNDIYVYVCGQIQTPGVYILPEGSRVCDLFTTAGGFTEQAAKDYWNQARLLKDGEMIYVPTKEEAKNRLPEGESTAKDTTSTQKKININTASKEELLTIPGVGEAKASAILTYREEHGGFSSIEDLKKVDGIKDGVFSKMKDYVEI